MSIFLKQTSTLLGLILLLFAGMVSITQAYTLSVAGDNAYAPNESININWSTTGNEEATKAGTWIGIFETTTDNKAYRKWAYTEKNQTSGQVALREAKPGTYEARLFTNYGYDQLAKSSTFKITENAEDNDSGNSSGNNGSGSSSGGTDSGNNTDNNSGGNNNGNTNQNSDSYSLSVADRTIDPGESISVTWTVDQSDNIKRDWIGVYKTGASNRNYEQWKYLKGNQLTFKINEPGTYEVRYFKDSGYTKVATSDTITVGSGSSSGGGDGNGGGDTDGGGDSDGDNPNNENIYSVRADKNSYAVGETAKAIWKAEGELGFFDWIGLYRPGTPDSAYLEYEYTDIFSHQETFDLNRSGTFEFRLFIDNGTESVAISEPFTVGTADNGNNLTCNGYDLNKVTNYPPANGPVIALGDSITAGVGATAGQDYVSELEKRLNINIRNEGVSGDTTEDVLLRLNSDVLGQDPSTVIVFIGGNDELRRVYQSLSDSAAERQLRDELEDYLQNRLNLNWQDVPLLTRQETFNNIRRIIQRIQDTGATTILVGFDTAIFDNTIADEYEKIAQDTGSIFIPDIYDGISGRPSRMSDLVHPNNRGYDIVADRIQIGLECLI